MRLINWMKGSLINMNKAFIFDMDGVIVNSEPIWERYEQKFLADLIGKDNYLRMKDQILGNSENEIYDISCAYGLNLNKQDFIRIYDDYAERVYKEAELTEGIEDLIEKLIAMNFKLGVVSSSRKYWIDLVLAKYALKSKFQYVLSINDTENMRTKPFPDGFVEAINVLNGNPSTTVILEDSNKGIEAAKSTGALTICLKENLPKSYISKGADIYVENIQVLINKIGGFSI